MKQLTPTEIKELGKQEVAYDRQIALCGKDKADNVLSFWILGYTYRQEQEANHNRDHIKKLIYDYTNKVSGLSLVHDPYLEELIDKILESK